VFSSVVKRTSGSPIAVLLSVLANVPAPACAADVFASVAVDGSVRYATQPLDNTYRLLMHEPAPAQPARRDEPSAAIKAIIDRVAQRHGLPADLVAAVAGVESNFSAQAQSRAGASGVMQLMPSTARQYGLMNAAELRDPERNIDAGVRHLKDLLAQYGGNVVLALSAYNAGAGAVARHRNRIPPYRETMLYVPAVLARTAATAAP
jgi:soluble lytic murein transglycosylase-like protein